MAGTIRKGGSESEKESCWRMDEVIWRCYIHWARNFCANGLYMLQWRQVHTSSNCRRTGHGQITGPSTSGSVLEWKWEIVLQKRRFNSSNVVVSLTYLVLNCGILQAIYPNACLYMTNNKVFNKLSLKYATKGLINQHWFLQWPGTEQAPSHYQNRWWPSSLTHV